MRSLGLLGLPSHGPHLRRPPCGSRTHSRTRGTGPENLSHVSQLQDCDVTSRISGSSTQVLGSQFIEWSTESSPNTVDAKSIFFSDRLTK